MDLSRSGLILSERTVNDLLEKLEAVLAEMKGHTIMVVAHLYDNCLRPVTTVGLLWTRLNRAGPTTLRGPASTGRGQFQGGV